jgi:hypothetical protein
MVFGLELLQAFRVRDAHTAEPAPPEVVAGFREAVVAAQVLDRYAGIGLSQEADDLGFRECFFIVRSPSLRAGL